MKPFDPVILHEAVSAGRIEWRRHVLQKTAERGLSLQAIRDVLLTGERIRDYADDKPFPSALFLGYDVGRPLHVVAACDETQSRVFVITAYEPSLDIFEADYKTKRKLPICQLISVRSVAGTKRRVRLRSRLIWEPDSLSCGG